MKEVSGSFLSDKDMFYEINRLNNSNVDYIHVDIMDGKFVDNKTITPNELIKVLDKCKKEVDMHLMVNNPEKYIKMVAYHNISYITIHYEIENFETYLDLIKNLGFKVGLSIKPSTPVEEIYRFLDKINLVLIMSVEPGKSGQSFIPETQEKINKLKDEINRRKLLTKISVDGGINDETKKYVENADILVSASFILNDLNNVNILKK